MGTEPLLSVPFAMYSKSSTESPWEVMGQDIYYNTGKVGIGLDTPLFTLDVRNPAVAGTADVFLSVYKFKFNLLNKNLTKNTYLCT